MRIHRVTILKDVMIGVIMILSIFVTSAVAHDAAISVNPTYVFYNDEALGDQSDPLKITLTNEAYGSGVNIASITLTGPNFGDFLISNDGCSGQTLTAIGDTCDIYVKFAPQTSGLKNALITIPYGASDQKLSVYLSNKEDTAHEVKRRLAPVIYDLNISEEMNAGSTYNLNWTTMGYHVGYETMIVIFDCTGKDPGTCGASYESSEKFYESNILIPAEITSGDWTYNGERTQNFYYTHSYSIPQAREDTTAWATEGTPIVIRFYVKSTEDEDAGKPSLSLIIPGNLSNDYYDTSGRKIQKIICPSVGCTAP